MAEIVLPHKFYADSVVYDKMSCDAPWYAGMAYAMGYIKALISNY